MFQIAFPLEHSWFGKSFALFFFTNQFHEEFCIPEFPDVIDLNGAQITKDFLDGYERNFKLLIFDIEKGVVRNEYKEKVVYKPLEMLRIEGADSQAEFVIGGEPIWIMGYDETPGSISCNDKVELLLQIREDYMFERLSEAKPQESMFGDRLKKVNLYELFAANRIYFWGTTDTVSPAVYISVQSP